jgi:hypothetical protein
MKMVFNSDRMLISEVRSILRSLRYGKTRLRLIDVTPGSGFGYAYEIRLQEKSYETFRDENGEPFISDWVWNDIEIIAHSVDTDMPDERNMMGGLGACGPTFDRSIVTAAISRHSANGRMIESAVASEFQSKR